jgi:DNA-3-methyladenine glycosylase I
MSTLIRCQWANSSQNMIDYHDHEWGRPVYDDLKLFQKLLLDMQQAGLSWAIILNKREDILEAFDGYDLYKLSHYTESDITRLINNPKIIRIKLKIHAMIHNAKMYIKHFGENTSFSKFLWDYVGGKTLDNHLIDLKNIQAHNEISDKISIELKKLGFKFVGSVTIYAFLQAVGIINDHIETCYIKNKTIKGETI